jgi:hypothetical protein
MAHPGVVINEIKKSHETEHPANSQDEISDIRQSSKTLAFCLFHVHPATSNLPRCIQQTVIANLSQPCFVGYS